MSANLALNFGSSSDVIGTNNTGSELVSEKRNIARVEMKTYNLKEVDALRKKLGYAYLDPAINLIDEASTGTCISVELKTSLFEMMKHCWIADMKEMNEINYIVAVSKAVAGTTNFGKVDVEFTLEATFTVNTIPNKVKVKCYPTKCKMTITHMGGNCVKKDHLDGNYSPRYFAEHFVLPWGRKMVESCEDLDDQIIPYLQKELKRVMEMNRKPKGSAPAKKVQSLNNIRSQGLAKCIARKCPSKNVLDVGNVGAFGICFKCGESEHFRCAGTKDEEKRDIIEGTQNYICS